MKLKGLSRPPVPTGDAAKDFVALTEYVYRLFEEIDYILSQIGSDEK